MPLTTPVRVAHVEESAQRNRNSRRLSPATPSSSSSLDREAPPARNTDSSRGTGDHSRKHPSRRKSSSRSMPKHSRRSDDDRSTFCSGSLPPLSPTPQLILPALLYTTRNLNWSGLVIGTPVKTPPRGGLRRTRVWRHADFQKFFNEEFQKRVPRKIYRKSSIEQSGSESSRSRSNAREGSREGSRASSGSGGRGPQEGRGL